MRGIIICNRCRRKMDGVCVPCQNQKCLIKIYWHGKHYEYRRDDQGYLFTYDKAKDRLAEISTAIKKGIFRPADFTDNAVKERKFENQAEKWLAEKEQEYATNELSFGTIKNYRGYVNNHFSQLHGLDVREIDLEHLTIFKDTLSALKIKTRKNILVALSSLFRWMLDRGAISVMPKFPEVKGEDAKARTAIDRETQDDILLRIPQEHREVIEFLMETGLRPGEACALLVEHVDFRSASARIERTFTGHRIRETTKQKRKQLLVLSNRAYDIALHHAQGKTPKQYLFVNPNTGRSYVPDTLWRIWHDNSGLPITLYEGTRHSFATQLIQDNDVIIVKELMRHSDIRMTEKYLHLRTSRLREKVNQRGKVISLANRTEIEPSSGEEK